MIDMAQLPELQADVAVIQSHMPFLTPEGQETMQEHLAELERSIAFLERAGR